MTPFTNRDRQAGRKAMEQSLSPMQRAYRKFLSGRPPAAPKNTPLGAVTLAAEQRKRLANILAAEGVRGSRITSMAVVIRLVDPRPGLPADAIPVEDGKESQAISALEMYGAKLKKDFIIAGLQFAVQDAKEKRFFAYPIDRTPEGEAALLWSCQRQSSGAIRKDTN
jgi:hypothetical protein